MPPSTCLVVLTDTLYLTGTLKTIASWRAHNPSLPVIALSYDQEALANPNLQDLAAQTHLIDTASYQTISPYKKSRSQRHAKTFYKFEAFRNFGYERNLFLDSDILCLRPCPLLTAPCDPQLLAAPDTGFRPTRGYKGHPNEINSGVLSIHNSIQGTDTVESLKTIARQSPGRSGYNSGDQGIINKWIHKKRIDLRLLPSEYNLIKKDYSDTSDLNTCRLLHLCHRKPWFPQPTNQGILQQLWLDAPDH